MLEFFRRNQLVYYVFVIVYLALISIPNFLHNSEVPLQPDGIFFNILIPFFENHSTLGKIISFILLLFQAFVLNEVVGRNRISNTNSLFPGIIYILLMSLYPEFMYTSSHFYANFFLILALRSFFDTDFRKRRGPKLFNTFMFLSMACLFSPVYIGFLLPFFFVTEVFINIKLKDFLIGLIGFLTPIYLSISLFYVLGEFELVTTWFKQISPFGLPFDHQYDTVTYVKLGLFALIFFVLLGANQDLSKSIHVHGRRKLSVLMILLVASIILVIFAHPTQLSNLMICIPFISIFLACAMLIIKNKQLAEVVHLLLISILIIFQYFI